MQDFTNDLWDNISSYYNSLIALMPKLGLSLIVLFCFVLLARLISRILQNKLAPRANDPLFVQFISRMVRYSLLVIAFLIILNIIGLGGIATSILAGAGVGAFVVGFAFKDIGENLLAGIMMAFSRPFNMGDVVELNGITGKVVALNLRDTMLKTFDGKDVSMPNGMVLKSPVINYTIDGFLRYSFIIGLDYGANLREAEKIILDTLSNIKGIERKDKKPSAGVSNLNSSTVDMTVYFWIDTFDKTVDIIDLKTEIYSKVLTNLKNAAFNLPHNIVEVKNYDGDNFNLSSFSKN